MRALVLCSLCLAFLGNAAYANGLGPGLGAPKKEPDKQWELPADKPQKVENAPVSLKYSAGVGLPQMFIPRKFAVMEGGKLGAVLDNERPSNRTMLAGISLSAGVVAGGFWVMRRSSRAAKPVLIVLIFSLGLFCSPFLTDGLSNLGRPPTPPQPTAPIKFEGMTAKLDMDVIFTADGDRIELVLPKLLRPAGMPQREEPGEAPRATNAKKGSE
jgi:hypothetical protein